MCFFFFTYWVSEFVYDSCKFACTQIGVGLIAGARTHHLARSKYQRGATWLPNSHDNTVKTGRIILGVTGAKVDILQVQITAKAHR